MLERNVPHGGAERFLHEIRTAARLTHPHVLPLHDSGEGDGLVYYVMPYIEGGSLRARAGGSLAYVGEISQHDVGFWGNMAFQALKALDYRSLTIDMNGPLAGEMVTEIRFAGVSQGKGTKSNFLLRRLAKLPFVFNVRVSAPFKQLLDSVQSWYDPNRLIERNLPALLQEQERSGGEPRATPPVQPRESDKLR